ncbi:MAG: polysaccharide biosynthesis C-terminal domain-containing protein, partial [Methanobacterium paludis]|nr:polysaccharide biosynthesis C-terminal domain-containing protein [Methanobacterium paludis]
LFVSINKQKLLLKILFICMIFNVIFNVLLIPTFSYLAAAFVTVITELFSFILCFHYLSKLICKIEIQKFVLKPVIASLLMGLFILFFKINFFLLIIISSILYFAILILLKTFTEEDINLIKQITHK